MTSATSSSSTTSQLPASDGSSDPHQWLEEVTGEEALAWVSERNQRAEAELEAVADPAAPQGRSEEHTSELQSRGHLVCRLLLEKKKKLGRTSTQQSERSVTDRTP